MGLRTSQSRWKARTIRPNILTLEDRVVPGEMFGTSMMWAMGAFVDPAALAPDTAADTARVSVVRSVQQADYSAPILPYADTSTISLCPAVSPAADAPATAAAPTQTDAPATANPASDQIFSTMSPDGNFADSIENGSGSSSAIGDMLHPGMETPSVPNSATGAAGPMLQSIVPAMSAALMNVGFSSGQGTGSAGASLAAMAGLMGNGAPAASATATAAPAPGGSATPLYTAHKVNAPDKVHPAAANGAAPFSPAQIDQAYGINLISNTGSGQTIYIVDAYNDPNITSDLATFDSQWGLSAPPSFTVHKMSSSIKNSSSWGIEESLDVEWAHAIAPKANIVLVEATTSSNANLFAAVNYATTSGAKIVSMSWGGSDASSDSSYNSYFEHSGVTYIASAGDTAAEVEYPAASPYVLAIGGTSLTLTTGNAYSSESAWADSGGGVSKYESEPAYQTSFGIKNSGRSIPDVAFDANPNTGVYVYDSYVRGGGGWYEVGGTSLGSPSWAGIIALADQTASTPLTTYSLTSRIEYTAASTSTLYSSDYHDVTSGSNGHAAGVGYDLVTGIGSPQVNNLVPYLSANG